MCENSLPFVSIIIPARDESRVIIRCLASVLALDWPRECMEVILVDNGSTDGTREIAAKMLSPDGRGRVLSKTDGSIASVRNFGWQHARGEVLAFIDADCVVDTKWLSFCISDLDLPNVGVVGTRAVPDFEQATWVEKSWYNLCSGAPRPDNPAWIGSSNLVIKKENFEEINGFDEKLETAEDADFCQRIRNTLLIMLEKRIDTIHLGESKSLRELFKRELWRGKSSIRQFFQTDNKSEVLTSVIVPPLFPAMLTFGLIETLYFREWRILLIAFILPFGFILKKKSKIFNLWSLLKVYAVAFVYLLARGCSFGYEILLVAVKFIKHLRNA